MNFRETDLGFNWELQAGDGPATINTQAVYEIDPQEVQAAWDSREMLSKVDGVANEITGVVFNPRAEQSLVYMTGWGVDVRRQSAGVDAALIAAANPEYRVDVINTSDGITPGEAKSVQASRNWADIVMRYTPYLYKLQSRTELVGLHGHSLGGLTLAHMLARPDSDLDAQVVTLHDVPGAADRNPLTFGLYVGVLDTALDVPHNPEQDVLPALSGAEPDTGPLTALRLAKAQRSLIGAMAQGTLEEALRVATARQNSDFYLFHGVYNRGMPVDDTTDMVSQLFASSGIARNKLKYYTGDSGHYFTGQSARMARLIRWAHQHTL